MTNRVSEIKQQLTSLASLNISHSYQIKIAFSRWLRSHARFQCLMSIKIFMRSDLLHYGLNHTESRKNKNVLLRLGKLAKIFRFKKE